MTRLFALMLVLIGLSGLALHVRSVTAAAHDAPWLLMANDAVLLYAAGDTFQTELNAENMITQRELEQWSPNGAYYAKTVENMLIIYAWYGAEVYRYPLPDIDPPNQVYIRWSPDDDLLYLNWTNYDNAEWHSGIIDIPQQTLTPVPPLPHEYFGLSESWSATSDLMYFDATTVDFEPSVYFVDASSGTMTAARVPTNQYTVTPFGIYCLVPNDNGLYDLVHVLPDGTTPIIYTNATNFVNINDRYFISARNPVDTSNDYYYAFDGETIDSTPRFINSVALPNANLSYGYTLNYPSTQAGTLVATNLLIGTSETIAAAPFLTFPTAHSDSVRQIFIMHDTNDIATVIAMQPDGSAQTVLFTFEAWTHNFYITTIGEHYLVVQGRKFLPDYNWRSVVFDLNTGAPLLEGSFVLQHFPPPATPPKLNLALSVGSLLVCGIGGVMLLRPFRAIIERA